MNRSIRFSVIIPTYQRRDIVLKSVSALVRQKFEDAFEVIVVVDGSTDGSADALRRLNTPFPLTVLEQSNRGAAMARNYGASIARGEILLFLDDDMEADPRLLIEHELSYQESADVVLGHLPLHPESPPGFLSRGIQKWADSRLEQLTANRTDLTLHDLLTGQISIRRETFQKLGGFDPVFTYGGSFGNEDIDFGYRLLLNEYKVVFNPEAISWQYYDVQPHSYLRKLYQVGQADVIFARKYPEQTQTIFDLSGYQRKLNKFLWRPIQRWPTLSLFVSKLLCWITLTLLDRQIENAITIRLFREAGATMYWRGAHEKGGMPVSKSVRVLAYHAICNLPADSKIAAYGVPPEQFEQQLDELIRAGYQFVDADEFLRFVDGRGGMPHRAVLLTFDDGYVDLLNVVLPLLVERSIPAIVFAVSSLLGGTNKWDTVIGTPELSLLDADDLKKLAQNGFEIGAHSRTHPVLTRLTDNALKDEIAGAIRELEACGRGQPRLFAYPYGESNENCQRAVQQAGILAAFTVRPGHVKPKQNPFSIPRIEILKGEVGWRLRLKIETADTLGIAAIQLKSLLDKSVAIGKAIRLRTGL